MANDLYRLDPVISPLPQQNEADGIGVVSRRSIAKQVVEDHMRALSSRRGLELIWEKLLLHIDGSGDFQWADIFNDTRVEIPRIISEFRKTENLLLPIVTNTVNFHCSTPFRWAVNAPPDRRSAEKALIDTIWANHLSDDQDLNNLFAEAMFMAMATGFCPVHAYWRDDVDADRFEPLPGEGSLSGMAPGMIDCWVGNPFDTVFNPGARKHSVRWTSYARLLPADAVRAAFGHLPGVAGLEGSTRISSTSEFQQIARKWTSLNLGIHGNPVMHSGSRGGGEELITVICREDAPGSDPMYPEGRLRIVAIPGEVDARAGRINGGHGVLLADQPLPAGEFSWSIFYSTQNRGSDIHGKPWVEDLDMLQVDLNIAKSKRWEAIVKQMEAPIVAPGGAIAEDMTDIGGYNLLELEPSLASWRPRAIEYSHAIIPALNQEIDDLRSAIYTLGGWQAASRGEAPGTRTAYRAIVALQQADDKIHGPVNIGFRRSAQLFMQRAWRQFKAYGDIPWLVRITGDEHAHLVEPYIDRTKVSDDVPQFKMVNSFGSTPEMRAQELTELVQLRGADGEPVLPTGEFRRLYPNTLIFEQGSDPSVVRRRRAQTVASAIHMRAKQFREQQNFEETSIAHPWVQQAGMIVFQQIMQEYPQLRDDDLEAHIAAMTEIAQDETADAIARVAAAMRQDMYFQWQAQMAQGMGAPVGTPMQPPAGGGGGGRAPGPGGGGQMPPRGGSPQQAGSGPQGPGGPPVDRRQVAAQMAGAPIPAGG